MVQLLLWVAFAATLSVILLLVAVPFWLLISRVREIRVFVPAWVIVMVCAAVGSVLTVTDETEGAFFVFVYAWVVELVFVQLAIWLDGRVRRSD